MSASIPKATTHLSTSQRSPLAKTLLPPPILHLPTPANRCRTRNLLATTPKCTLQKPNPIHTAAAATTTAAAASAQSSPQLRVDILSESLPFIQKFHGKIIVVKYGGAAMKSHALQQSVVQDIVLLNCVGLLPVLVHGGGPEINQWLQRLAIEPQFLNGLRVTDSATMEIVEMVLVGKVNKALVSLINKSGGSAVGISGKDGRLLIARPSLAATGLGFVGDVAGVSPGILQALLGAGHIPVVASVAADEAGQAYNINADTVAGEVAAALGAEKLILLTDVPGILTDRTDPGSLVKEVDIKGVKRLVEEGKVSGGMIPKVNCCVRSLAQGVKTASVIDGRLPHSLLLEILTDEGAGTMITG